MVLDHGRALLLDISHHMSILLEAPSAEKRKEWLTTLQQLQEAKFGKWSCLQFSSC
jgi:hypothetical protein